jgi:biopolymer transport protein TolR
MISLKSDGKLYLMDTALTPEELVPRLAAVAKTGVEERIYVRADKSIAYGRVAEVMGMISAAGYKKIALVNEPEQKR